MIGDFYEEKWRHTFPLPQLPNWPPGPYTPITPQTPIIIGVSKEEFDALKKEVLEMKELLKRAIKYDEDNNQPNCEKEEKIAILKKVAEWVGVSLDDVLK
jgi:hypothetical protein